MNPRMGAVGCPRDHVKLNPQGAQPRLKTVLPARPARLLGSHGFGGCWLLFTSPKPCRLSRSVRRHLCLSLGTPVSGSAYESSASKGSAVAREAGWLAWRSFPQTVQALSLPTCISTGEGGVCVCMLNSGIQLGLEGLKCLEKMNLFAHSGGNRAACTETLAHCSTESLNCN